MDDTINLNTKILFNHIQKRNEAKENNRINIYNRILQRVQKKIFLAAKHELYNINFEVPGIIFGEPIYSVEECSKYITNNLESNGFNVHLYTKKQLKKLGIQNVNSCIININWESLKNDPTNNNCNTSSTFSKIKTINTNNSNTTNNSNNNIYKKNKKPIKNMKIM